MHNEYDINKMKNKTMQQIILSMCNLGRNKLNTL